MLILLINLKQSYSPLMTKQRGNYRLKFQNRHPLIKTITIKTKQK